MTDADTTFRIEALPARHGDALIVEYGTDAKLHQILIDAGSTHSWPEVRSRLTERVLDRYEAFVVTHVDEDHVGGAIDLLDDPDLKHRVKQTWFNGLGHCDAGGNVLGYVNGEQLTRRIIELGRPWNAPFHPNRHQPGGGPVVVGESGDLPTVPLPGGARAVIVGPTVDRLRRMVKPWRQAVIDAGLVPGEGDDRHTKGPAPHAAVVPDLPADLDLPAVQRLAADASVDTSKPNGSSIAFVLEFDERRILLCGDAHASDLAAGLRRYGQMVDEERPRIDLVKLPHHGSRGNVSADLLAAMHASRFLISTDGENYGHPDDAAIARVLLASDGGPVTFHCNYASARTTAWANRTTPFDVTFELPSEPGIVVEIA